MRDMDFLFLIKKNKIFWCMFSPWADASEYFTSLRANSVLFSCSWYTCERDIFRASWKRWIIIMTVQDSPVFFTALKPRTSCLASRYCSGSLGDICALLCASWVGMKETFALIPCLLVVCTVFEVLSEYGRSFTQKQNTK